ncbi:wax ester/triacylglycerol synthase family O-acyltransferase [Myxococcota bacterium]|nr:wax ester/triacylglycerol synthase family O-acyltransferase [Myxococcota bacterium]
MSYHYDRLTAMDNAFLILEKPEVQMHVASTMIFETGPLATTNGGINVESIKGMIRSSLHRIPRYRQRIQTIPLDGRAVWVDDPHFDLDYHIRHTALPKPGTPEQLKKLSARVMAQPLDRNRPLWETWIVEGLDGGKGFAMITKVHHCMIDGIAGVDLAFILLSTEPEPIEPSEAPRFMPRPVPTGTELLMDELGRRAQLPLRLMRGVQSFIDEADDLREEISVRAGALLQTLGAGLRTDATPLNGKLGPHRAFDWYDIPLEEFRAIRKSWNCTINDVVLTIVTGAVREYFIHRSVDPSRIDFKVSTPVSVRGGDEQGELGNRVSSWVLSLPISEHEPRKQLESIHSETSRLKQSRQALGVEMMMKVAEWTPATLLSLGAQSISGPINTIITNVPGPQVPLYCQGARLRGMYPLVPLMENLGLGIALISSAGTIHWGFNADPDVVPDLDVFVEKIKLATQRVRDAAGIKTLGAPVSRNTGSSPSDPTPLAAAKAN